MVEQERESGEAPAARTRGGRKVRQGVVVSDKMDKTVVVLLEKTIQHPLYRKRLRRTSRIKAHDEENTCRVGDRVK